MLAGPVIVAVAILLAVGGVPVGESVLGSSESGLHAHLSTSAAQAATGTQQPITGRLNKRGYTVIAVGANGKARVRRASHGSFRIRPLAKISTLHLRSPDGTYAGPVVLARMKKGKRAIVGVKPGAKLGKVEIKPRRGFASVKRLGTRQRKRWVAWKFWARALKGVPIGNGVNFGRVRSTKVKRKQRAPGDRDVDGVTNSLDIDDDGDLVLDSFEVPDANATSAMTSGARASADSPFPSGQFPLSPWLVAPTLYAGLNANAPGVSDGRIEAVLPSLGRINMDFLAPQSITSIELDCGQPQDSATPGLVYCTKGGSGGLEAPWESQPPTTSFPDCCDPDGDGMGSLFPNERFENAPADPVLIYHHATSEEIGPGDVLIQRIEHDDGSEEARVATLGYVFETAPGLVSYDDGQGNEVTVDYANTDATRGDPPGTDGAPFPVNAGPSGDVIMTLTFWRPQRRAIPPEEGKWIDLGGLGYGAYVLRFGSPDASPEREGYCNPSTYSTADPNLTPLEVDFDFGEAHAGGGGGFWDLTADQPASRDNTFTYQLNLTECLELRESSFNPGETRHIWFTAGTRGNESGYVSDATAFKVAFEHRR